jgi:hypothetical protein
MAKFTDIISDPLVPDTEKDDLSFNFTHPTAVYEGDASTVPLHPGQRDYLPRAQALSGKADDFDVFSSHDLAPADGRTGYSDRSLAARRVAASGDFAVPAERDQHVPMHAAGPDMHNEVMVRVRQGAKAISFSTHDESSHLNVGAFAAFADQASATGRGSHSVPADTRFPRPPPPVAARAQPSAAARMFSSLRASASNLLGQ